ncbi:hypothetical protein PLEOSDRAFT_153814 [Pleurotus ostreatus PC15]|uniref:Uncharacterized protein n=1 Tax=Pleurotus ostreatus (strain PC15) TaxID=1137138 RepID=A0A067P9C8_PLEO1|nr:hypothetical protein PLEOSDRAFT_153814 [Pleurotus ostreatus PC15]
MDHRFERLDLRDLNAGGAFELQRIRDPWLTKRLKWISLSMWTLAQVLTEECCRSETLRNAPKTNLAVLTFLSGCRSNRARSVVWRCRKARRLD